MQLSTSLMFSLRGHDSHAAQHEPVQKCSDEPGSVRHEPDSTLQKHACIVTCCNACADSGSTVRQAECLPKRGQGHGFEGESELQCLPPFTHTVHIRGYLLKDCMHLAQALLLRNARKGLIESPHAAAMLQGKAQLHRMFCQQCFMRSLLACRKNAACT